VAVCQAHGSSSSPLGSRLDIAYTVALNMLGEIPCLDGYERYLYSRGGEAALVSAHYVNITTHQGPLGFMDIASFL
jgi:hypothetical protein